MLVQGEAVAITLADGAQHRDRGGGDLGTYAVAGQNDDFSVHDGTPVADAP